MWSGSRTVGTSAGAPPPGSGSLTTYWCLIGTIGTATPASRATWPAAAPAASTTISVAIRPLSVRTARTRPAATSIPVTAVFVANCTPSARAPAANAPASASGRR
jgi:hypothetical protein